jgi:acyl-CoA synthetase (AMP-forming)/AMP-acid ligase II
MNLASILTKQSDNLGLKPALIFKDSPITFLQLKENTFRLASSLIQLGIKKGDRVAFYLPNSPEYIYSYLAIWCLGAVAVPLDYMLTEEELVSCLTHSEARILIARSKPNLSWIKLKDRCLVLRDIILSAEKQESFLSFDELLAKGRPEIPFQDIPDNDCAIIFYTSGTTGKPKGVLANYRQVGAPALAMKYFVDLGTKETTLCALPFSHLGGLVFIQSLAYLGTTVVLMERFIPVEFLKNIVKYKVNCFWLVPSMYYAILQLKEFEVFDLSSITG